MADVDIEARGASASAGTPPFKSEKDVHSSSLGPSSTSIDDMAAADSASVSVAKPWHQRAVAYFTANTMEAGAAGPIPVEKRTDKRAYTAFTLWFTLNCNILPITFGMLGPEFGCSLRDSALITLFFTLVTAVAPAYFSTLGPQTGMRQMMQARYSFGRYIVSIPVLLNMATLTGFCVIMVVIGGQCLTAVSGGSLSPYVGVVVVSIVALFISFCGYKVLHLYEAYSWAPALLAIIVATGCGGKHLKEQTVVETSPAASIVSYGMVVASYMLPWAAIASDFFTYLDPKIKP
jgi:purine-cytosine permease-like protein